MRIAFIGPSGSGKDTQIELLQNLLNIPNLSTGEILKDLIAHHDPVGMEVKKYVDHGWWGERYLELDEMILKTVISRIKKGDCGNGFIFNGFPRTVHQAEMYEDFANSSGMSLSNVVYFELSEKEAIKRLSNRRICRDCGEIYHLVFNPSNKEE